MQKNGWTELEQHILECNYTEIDRQLKEQSIHGLNDSGMLAEIFRELTKTEENAHVTS